MCFRTMRCEFNEVKKRSNLGRFQGGGRSLRAFVQLSTMLSDSSRPSWVAPRATQRMVRPAWMHNKRCKDFRTSLVMARLRHRNLVMPLLRVIVFVPSRQLHQWSKELLKGGAAL